MPADLIPLLVSIAAVAVVIVGVVRDRKNARRRNDAENLRVERRRHRVPWYLP